MSFGLLFSSSERDNAFKLAPTVSALGRGVNVIYNKLPLKLPKASLTSARIGEGLRMPNAIRLMHIPGLKRRSGRFYWLLSWILLLRRNIRARVTKTQTFLRLQCAALILSRSLNSKSNVTVKLSFNLVLNLVHSTYGFLVSYRSIIAFRAAISPHKSARSIKEEMSKTLLPNTFIFSFATKHFVRQIMQHSPPQEILILWRYLLIVDRFKGSLVTTITRIAWRSPGSLICSLIQRDWPKKKTTKAVTSQKSFCISVSQTLFSGGEKRPPELRLRSQASWSIICYICST